MAEQAIKVITENRKARHDFHIEETVEAGIVLHGTEVKSLRQGKVNLRESHARIDKNNEIYLYGVHISPYDHGNRHNHDPLRPRKLLLHKREIAKLAGKIREKGYTLVPLKIYFKEGKCKADLAVAKGKKIYDKREAIANKEAARRIERTIKNR